MAGDIASGLFALGGASIGGLASWAASAAQGRSQRVHASDAHDRTLVELRRQAYIDFVIQVDGVADVLREVYNTAQPAQVSEQVKQRYAAAWQQFLGALATVEVTGPQAVADCAAALRDAIASMCNRVDQWLSGKKWSSSDESLYDSANIDHLKHRSAFLSAARTAMKDS